jgi:putative chitinase
MPSSVGGGGSSSRDNSCNNSSSMNNSQRSSNINSNNESSTKSSQSQSTQSTQSKGNLAGTSVSKSTSTPTESPAQQAARCNPAQSKSMGNLGGMNVSKTTSTPAESPAQQAARCNPAQSKSMGNLGGMNVSKTPTTNESPVSNAAQSTAKATDIAKAQAADKAAEVATQAATPNAANTVAQTPATQSYTVKKGDTLSGIAVKAGTTVKDIVAANPEITNPDRILAGQKIEVPTKQVSQPPANVDALTNAANAANPANPAKAPAKTNPANPPDAAQVPAEVEAIAAKLPANAVKGLTVEQLKAIVPNLPLAKAKEYLPHLNAALAEFNINTPLRQAAFVAQLAHESVGLTAFQEFASGRAYEGRKDLGNVVAGDGVRFKGRGPIQLTGRANYREVGKALGVDLENNPKLASNPEIGFRIAGHFFESRGLNKLADQQKFDAITKRVNGGFNGKADRDRYYARAKDVLL